MVLRRVSDLCLQGLRQNEGVKVLFGRDAQAVSKAEEKVHRVFGTGEGAELPSRVQAVPDDAASGILFEGDARIRKRREMQGVLVTAMHKCDL